MNKWINKINKTRSIQRMEWNGNIFTKGIQLTAAHSGGRYSDLTQEEVQHLWRYNLYSQG